MKKHSAPIPPGRPQGAFIIPRRCFIPRMRARLAPTMIRIRRLFDGCTKGTIQSYRALGMVQPSRKSLTFTLLIFLSLILSSCGFPGVVTTAGQLPVVNSTPQAQPLPPVRFPQDEAAHRDLNEWWYYTGHMNAVTPDGKAHQYGFELVFFQALRSDLPPFYAAHFAISDVTRGEFHFDQRRLIEPDAVIPNGTSTSGIRVSIGDWSIQGVNGLDHLAAEMPNYTLHVDALGLKPATLHNGNGLITYGLGGFSYYYSRTRMALSGSLIDHHQPLRVHGVVWMDHQWGNFLTLGGGGWDWFSIQLNNDTEMMLYLIRDATGKTISTYVESIGPRADVHLLPAGALRVEVLDQWKSPVTGVSYPSGWHLEVNNQQLQASLTLTPELKDQELVVYQSTGNTYWEGAVSIQGQSAGQFVQGEGYVELTGYTLYLCTFLERQARRPVVQQLCAQLVSRSPA